MTVGLVIMSERELNQIEVLSQVTQGQISAVAATNFLGLITHSPVDIVSGLQKGRD